MTHSLTHARILIVDDDEKQLASMRRILHGHFETVTTTDPVQALRIFELQGPFAVVISDFQMPLMNGVQLFARIVEIDPTAQRILITGRPDLQMAIDAVNHGKITAFLTKPTPIVSIRSVVCDAVQSYNQLRETDDSPPERPLPPANHYATLTIKEKEVLLLLSKGFSNEEISAELLITVGTVKTHVNSLFGKLDVNNRTKVVARALELDLIKPASIS